MTTPKISTLAVIPARWRSSRFPGKPLAKILGREMVLRVHDQVAKATCIDAIVVATDDERIAEVCRAEGVDVVMTSPDHATGTDRLAEVAAQRDAEVYVNVQGDEPIIAPAAIDAVTRRLLEVRDQGIGVANGYIEGATAEQEQSLSCVHVVTTLDGCIMMYSRLPIPVAFDHDIQRNVQVGLYAFTKDTLADFARWDRGPVERAENVELIRFLEHDRRIAAVPVPGGSIGVDHPQDVVEIEAFLQN